MSISMYSASVPVAISVLSNLDHLLQKTQAFVEAKKIDPQAILQFRLAPDMLPFIRQIHIACDGAKMGVARLSGVEAPKFADEEKTLAELRERIAKTQDYLRSVPAEALAGTDVKEVTFPIGRDVTRTLSGEEFLLNHMLPNFYFHVTTAYAILRHNGVEIGKADYLRGGRG